MTVLFEGRKYFAGTLAKKETRGRSRRGDTKAHNEIVKRVLIAIHRYCYRYGINDNEFHIVVGQPIAKHVKSEKDKIKRLLRGSHDMAIDYACEEVPQFINKSINITKVEVAAEGLSAIFSEETDTLVRQIDIGSGTVNFSSTENMSFIDMASDSMPYGLQSAKIGNDETFATEITNFAFDLMWEENDIVRVLGGGAERLLPYIKRDFPNARLLTPTVRIRHDVKTVDPTFANAVGFYKIGRMVYG